MHNGSQLVPTEVLPTFQSFRSRFQRVPAAALVGVLLFCALLPHAAHADAISDLEAQIAADQAQLNSISAQEASINSQISDAATRAQALQAVITSLNSQLAAMNAQLSAGQHRLQELTAQEERLAAQLAATEADLAQRQQTFGRSVRALEVMEQEGMFGYLLTSNNFGDLLTRFMGWHEITDYIHRQAVQLEQERDQIKADKAQVAAEKQQQAVLVAELQKQRDLLASEYAQQQQAEQELFALEAQLGQERSGLMNQAGTLQQQISSDQSQVASLLAFSQSQAGSGGSILSPEYLSDGWGTYYNQRDARWGNDYVGPSPYQVWAIGCLLSDVAMMYTHFGLNYMNPGSLAGNQGDFDSNGDMYFSAENVPGHPADINQNPTTAWIDAQLASGGAVIVGMYISGGTHYVTLTAMNGPGDYWMNDPWEPNAMHVSFDSSPVTGPIYQAIAYH